MSTTDNPGQALYGVPLPWKAEQSNLPSRWWYVVDADGQQIGDVYTASDVGSAEEQRVAQLWASAPELLDCARLFLPMLRDLEKEGVLVTDWGLPDVIAQVERTIGKAEARQEHVVE